MSTVLQDGQTFLFTGDSITDCGRRSIESGPLGSGYVGLFNDILLVREPEKSLQFINTGIGGDTVEGLRNRWLDDVIVHRPDWVSIKIGINDCHRYKADPVVNEVHGPEGYARNYEEILTVTRKLLPNVQLLLIDPFYASADLGEELPNADRARTHELLPEYIATVDRLGKQFGARRVKTHELFTAQFQHKPRKFYFPNEPVHPNRPGHLLIAEAVYNALS